MLAFDRSFPKKLKDRWDYCNKEAIAKIVLEMYKDMPSDQDIIKVIEEYKLYKLGLQKVAGLWKPPFIRMKRLTSKSNLHRNGAADKETSGGESTQNQELSTLEIKTGRI